MALTDVEFAALLALQHELRGVEFKPPGRRDDQYLFAQVARAALGMANTRDGGRVIIGVEEQDGRFTPVGLSPAQRATWRYDDVAARLASYADPTLDFTLMEVKGVRRFLSRARAVGLLTPATLPPTEQQLFSRQRENLEI